MPARPRSIRGASEVGELQARRDHVAVHDAGEEACSARRRRRDVIASSKRARPSATSPASDEDEALCMDRHRTQVPDRRTAARSRRPASTSSMARSGRRRTSPPSLRARRGIPARDTPVSPRRQEPSRVFPPALFAGSGSRLGLHVVTLIAGMAVPTDDTRGLGRPAARGHAARAAGDEHEGVLGDRAVRAHQRRADQHDHGVAPDLRHVAAGDRAARDGAGARRAAHAVGGDRVRRRARLRAVCCSATSCRSPTPPCCSCSSVFIFVNVAVLVLRREPVDPSTGGRRPCCR